MHPYLNINISFFFSFRFHDQIRSLIRIHGKRCRILIPAQTNCLIIYIHYIGLCIYLSLFFVFLFLLHSLYLCVCLSLFVFLSSYLYASLLSFITIYVSSVCGFSVFSFVFFCLSICVLFSFLHFVSLFVFLCLLSLPLYFYYYLGECLSHIRFNIYSVSGIILYVQEVGAIL